MQPGISSSPSAGLRKMYVIGPSAFLASVGTGCVNLGMILILREVFGASPSVVGWFGAVWSLVYLLSNLALRPLTFRLVPRVSMRIMLLSMAASLVFFCLFPGRTTAFLTYGACGFFLTFFWPPVMGWVSRGLEDKRLSKANGLFSFSWSAGNIVSPYIAGYLSQRGKFLPIYAAVAFLLANAVFLKASVRFLRDGDERPKRVAVSVSSTPDSSTPLRFPAWVALFVMYAAVGLLTNIFPLFAREELSLSESRTGLLVAVRCAASAGGFILFGRFSFWRFRKKFLVLPTALIGAFGLILALAGTSVPIVAAGLAGLGLMNAWTYNNSMFYGASGARDRDLRMAIHEALLTAASILGSLAGGFLYQAASMRLAFLVVAASAAAGVCFQTVLLRTLRGKIPQAPEPRGKALFPSSRRGSGTRT